MGDRPLLPNDVHRKRNGKNAFHFYGSSQEYGDGQTVDLPYLHAYLSRSDIVSGAYQLSIETFQYVFNFLQRFADQNNQIITTLLFTICETEDESAMEILKKSAGSLLRRSDLLTEYSSRQLMAVLPCTADADAVAYAKRIVENFKNTYTGDSVQIDYAVSRMDTM